MIQLQRNFAWYEPIFMANIEGMLMSRYTGEPKPKLWKRFIDDIFFIWEGDEDSLFKFFNTANSIHDSIKFEFYYSKTSINFLDTTIRFDKTNNLESTLFVKENDICTLLHSDSYHPDNTRFQQNGACWVIRIDLSHALDCFYCVRLFSRPWKLFLERFMTILFHQTR